MEKEMIRISKKVYEELLEEVGILKNPEIINAIKENSEAKMKGIKTWELDF